MITRQPRFFAVLACAVILVMTSLFVFRTDIAAIAQILSTRANSLPEYLVEAKDPVSGLMFKRVTKPGDLGNGVECSEKNCGHRYSSAQAWNADQSLLLISSGCSGLCFFDGRTYSPLFFRARSDNCEWLPDNPEHMICVGDRDIRLWAPRADVDTLIFRSDVHKDLQLGPGKGNPSLDGSRIAVRASTGDGKFVVFVYDLNKREKFPDIDLSSLPGRNGYCTIAPLGEKVVCFQTLADETQQTFILSKEGQLLQSWLENHRPGHGDMTVGADGAEIMVGISKSKPDKYQVISRRLDNGLVTKLLPYGEATHVSLRAIANNGWAIVSYEGDPEEVASHPKWAPYSRQVVAVALDGSGRVRPIARTNNIKNDYHSETHASPSPDGTQIIWSSNWGKPDGRVYEFVTQVPWTGVDAKKWSKTQ